eukprot:5078710-Alexandrium_andersonii.AAC.1
MRSRRFQQIGQQHKLHQRLDAPPPRRRNEVDARAAIGSVLQPRDPGGQRNLALRAAQTCRRHGSQIVRQQLALRLAELSLLLLLLLHSWEPQANAPDGRIESILQAS